MGRLAGGVPGGTGRPLRDSLAAEPPQVLGQVRDCRRRRRTSTPERKDAAGAGTAAAMADLPATRLRWLGSVRGPLFLPGPRRVPRHATPLMTRSQRLATNRDLTRQMILERPWVVLCVLLFMLGSAAANSMADQVVGSGCRTAVGLQSCAEAQTVSGRRHPAQIKVTVSRFAFIDYNAIDNGPVNEAPQIHNFAGRRRRLTALRSIRRRPAWSSHRPAWSAQRTAPRPPVRRCRSSGLLDSRLIAFGDVRISV